MQESTLSRSFLAGGVAALILAAVSQPATAAAPQKKAAPVAASPYGRIGGVWHVNLRRALLTTDSNGNPPPFLPAAQAVMDERVKGAKEGKPFADSSLKCLPYGVGYFLFASLSGPIQIIEQPEQVTLISTEFAEVWMIHLNRKQHPKDVDPGFHGDSIGHWEGDTLVVDTIGLSGEKTTLDPIGTPHSDDLHIVTRFHRTATNELEARMLMDDPKTFSHPWERRVTFTRAKPGAELHEYICEPPPAYGAGG